MLRASAVLIGVSMGLLAFLVDIVLQRLNSFKFNAVRSVVSHHGGFWAPYMVWLCFTMGYAALSAYLVTSFAPLGAGSGIPEIKTYLNGVHIKGINPSGTTVHLPTQQNRAPPPPRPTSNRTVAPAILCWSILLPSVNCPFSPPDKLRLPANCFCPPPPCLPGPQLLGYLLHMSAVAFYNPDSRLRTNKHVSL